MSWQDYSCGTCGSRGLVIKGGHGVWNITCFKGHTYLPTPGTVMEVAEPEVQTIDVQLIKDGYTLEQIQSWMNKGD